MPLDGNELYPTGGGRPPLQPGMLLQGKFTLVHAKAGGGMGEVWLATDRSRPESGQPGKVALKFLHGALRQDHEADQSFRKEFERVWRLDSEHICRLYELGFEPGVGSFIVMQYLEGQTLRETLRSAPSGLPIETALPILRGIAKALDQAHDFGIVHRDVKPENVVYNRQTGAVHVIDFGIAAEIQHSLSRLSGSVTVAQGTPVYMAPEQWDNQPPTRHTDIWALGVLATELLTGCLPFHCPNMNLAQHVIRNSPAQPLPAHLKQLQSVFDKVLQKRPEHRFACCRDFVQALTVAGANRPVQPVDALLTPLPQPAVTHVQRSFGPAVLLGAFLALVVILGTGFAVYRARNPAYDDAPALSQARDRDASAFVPLAEVQPSVPSVVPAPSSIPGTPSPQQSETASTPVPAAPSEDTAAATATPAAAEPMVGTEAAPVRSTGELTVSPIRITPSATYDEHVVQVQQLQAETARRLSVPVEHTNTIGMTLRLIPPGEFLMGAAGSDPDGQTDERPQHPVTITKVLYVGVTEVTQGQWAAVMQTEPWKGRSCVLEGSDVPATYVSWEDATEFCQRLSALEGRRYRLPTEAEWAWSSRAGTTTRFYHGDDEERLGEYAWFYGNANNAGERYAHRVGQKLPNPFGLYDTLGNVWEWCGDWYGHDYYARSPSSDPQGPSSGSFRVLRGGSWYIVPIFVRCADRYSSTPDDRTSSFGLRVVLE